MKITVIDTTTKRPVANTKIQLQVKGKDSGFLSLTTDGNGTITLEDKYNGQQISATNNAGGQPSQGISASEGAKLYISQTGSKQKSTTETSGGNSTR